MFNSTCGVGFGSPQGDPPSSVKVGLCVHNVLLPLLVLRVLPGLKYIFGFMLQVVRCLHRLWVYAKTLAYPWNFIAAGGSDSNSIEASDESDEAWR